MHNFVINDGTFQSLEDQTEQNYIVNQIKQITGLDVSLKEIANKKTPYSKHITFVQQFSEIEIFNSFVKVNFTNTGKLLSFSYSIYNTKNWNENIYQSDSLFTKIRSEIDFKQYIQLEKVLFPKEINFEFAIKALYHQKSPLILEEQIIGIEGLLYKEDKIRYSKKDTTIYVQVFNPDPLTTANEMYQSPFRDFNDSSSLVFLNQMKRYDVVGAVDTISKKYTLKNSKLDVIDYSPPQNIVPVLGINSFFFERNQKEFESVNAYYHISKIDLHFKSLGYINLMDSLLAIDAHGKFDDNSAFLEDTKPMLILFGDGGVDDAEDADVIVHEFCHYVSAQASPRSNSGFERRAIDEGMADYFACAYSKSISNYRWKDMFTWDGHNEYWRGRSLANFKTYPDSVINNDIHNTGVIWAGLFANINESIGRNETDLLMLQCLYSFFPDMTYTDATAILQQAEALLFNKKYKCIIQKHLRDRNLIDQSIHLECYNEDLPIDAGLTNKEACKNNATELGIKPENLINKDQTYNWKPYKSLNNYSIPNPIFSGDTPINYTLTVCDKNGKCRSKNILITIASCHKIIAFYNYGLNFNNGNEPIIIRLPDQDNLLNDYYIQVFNSIGQLVSTRKLINKSYFHNFYKSELPEANGVYILRIIKAGDRSIEDAAQIKILKY